MQAVLEKGENHSLKGTSFVVRVSKTTKKARVDNKEKKSQVVKNEIFIPALPRQVQL